MTLICRTKKDSTKYFIESDWQVFTDDKDIEIFISLCGYLVSKGASENCDSDSLVCLKNKGQVQNQKVKASKIHIEELSENHLRYDLIGKDTNVRVLLLCAPGGHSRLPELTGHNEDFTKMEIIWRTAAACKTEKIEGSIQDCRINNEKGFVIDLNSLRGEISLAGEKGRVEKAYSKFPGIW